MFQIIFKNLSAYKVFPLPDTEVGKVNLAARKWLIFARKDATKNKWVEYVNNGAVP